jgi:hypothetical protein
MLYLTDLGCEDEGQEYKVFTFDPYNIGINDGFKLLKSGKWIFDDLTRKTLKKYIENYFPKYISTFSHPLTRVKTGNFYIGVDDDGIAHGIPYSGVLTESFIQKEIKMNMTKLRGSVKSIEQYLSSVKIEIIKLEKTITTSQLTEYDLDSDFAIKTYTTLMKQKEIDEFKHNDYITKKRRYEKFYNSFPQKINEILNNKTYRIQIIDLIKKKGKSTTKLNPKYKNIYGWCDIKTDYWNIISELKTNKFEPITFERAEKIRNDPLSPIYWGLVWRDLKTLPCKILKPKFYKPVKNHKHYSLLFATQVPKMIPSWIKNNPELNLYVIKIIFSGNISPELFLEYCDTDGKWHQSYRTITNGDPRCQPAFI